MENLSEEMLKLFADMDPNAAVDAVDLVGGALDLEILGFELTDYILGLIADFGLCTNPATGSVVLDESYVTDLESLDRFNDAQAGETLRTMVHLLAAIHDTSTSEIPALVGLLSNADDHGLTEPAEEALRDLGDAALLSDVVNLLPGLLEPDDYSDDHDYPDGVEPVDFAAVWDILRASATLSTDDRTPVEDLAEPIAAAAGQAETWEAIGNLAVMLQDPSQHLHTRGSGLDQLLELDPELALIRAVGGVMLSPDAGGALLRIAEQQEVIDALGRASGEGEEQEGPLPFTAHLITHGTVEALLDVLDRILGSL